MIEKEFDQMLEDLDSANDEFVNDYFNDMNDLVFEKQEKLPIDDEEEPSVEEVKEEVQEEKTEVSEEPSTDEEMPTSEESKKYKNRFTSFSMTSMKKSLGKNIEVHRPVKVEEKKEEVVEEPKKTFSYSEILNRLDQEKKYDLNNANDLMKFIDKCNTSDEFFEYIESEKYGK
jgi:hypothetical protein